MDPQSPGPTYLDSAALESVPDHSHTNDVFEHITCPDRLVVVNAKGIYRRGEICEPRRAPFYNNCVRQLLQGTRGGQMLRTTDLEVIYADYSTNPNRVLDLSCLVVFVLNIRHFAQQQFRAILNLMNDWLDAVALRKLIILMDIIFHFDNLLLRLLDAKCTQQFEMIFFPRMIYHMPFIRQDMDLAFFEDAINTIELDISGWVTSLLHDGIRNGNRIL
ncbi:hypothetical protein F4805DRAFT_30366 [Annulohypoxylon moriforme]|nr:hypothetical protein F4805DRAFT_30366 [Annulohypoxylon moriforme]